MIYYFFSDNLRLILTLGMSVFITLVLIPSIVDIARAKSLVATPNVRTSHTSNTPNLGGIAIFIGFMISCLIFLNSQTFFKFQYLVVGCLIIFFIGFKDDIIGITPYKKFLGQVIAALLVMEFGDLFFTSLHGLFNIYGISRNFGLVLALITIIGITNCYNLMDGIDGLAAGLGILSSVVFGIWFYLNGDIEWAVLAAGLAGSLIAFFYFNMFGKRNKIFMGDTGALILGFVISLITIHFNELSIMTKNRFDMHAAPAVSFGILIVPVFDALRVMITRIINNKPPFYPDRTHIHHYLLDLGFSHLAATSILLLVSLGFSALSFAFSSLTVFWLLSILLPLAGLLSAIPISLVYYRDKKLKKSESLDN